MKSLILFSLFAFCYAIPALNKNVNIGHDGTITITEPNGKRIVISKNVDSYGAKNIEISVDGPLMPSKKIKILDEPYHQNSKDVGVVTNEELREKRSSKKQSQGDLLLEIFQAHEGTLDEKSYQKLLKKLQKAVESGDLSPEVFWVLAGAESGNIVPSVQESGNVVRPVDQLVEKKKILENIIGSKLPESNVWEQKALLDAVMQRNNILQHPIVNPYIQKQQLVNYPQLLSVLNRLPVNNAYGSIVERSQLLNHPELYGLLNRVPADNVYGNIVVPDMEPVSQRQVSPVNWQQYWLNQQIINELKQRELLERYVYQQSVPVRRNIERQSYWPSMESVKPEYGLIRYVDQMVPVVRNQLWYLPGQNVPYYGYEGVQHVGVPQNVQYAL